MDAELFACLARHARHTAGSESHPLPDRKQIEQLFDWRKAAEELNSSEEELMARAFGSLKKGRREGLLKARREKVREQLGVILLPEARHWQ